ncbi:MAG TPA: class D sortase [Candidatus Baltobacteraceae bacterium]|nr:class D sortase [Candidatus Baltobacteraceae bacterium]
METMGSNGSGKIRIAERILLAIGVSLLLAWAAARFHGRTASDAAIERFYAESSQGLGAPSAGGVDFAQWSPQRIEAYKGSLAAKKDLPLAILRIPKIHLEVPVFNATDDLTLNRGVGRIIGTAHIGGAGNIGIAGHRDGFFRGLKDVGRDDVIELILPERTDKYIITDIQIVGPENVSVLDATPAPTLTLVTCYPFYFVGSAPQRYIVSASKQVSGQPDESVDATSSSTGKKINKKENAR